MPIIETVTIKPWDQLLAESNGAIDTYGNIKLRSGCAFTPGMERCMPESRVIEIQLYGGRRDPSNLDIRHDWLEANYSISEDMIQNVILKREPRE